MKADDMAWQLHEDGDCDPMECSYCDPADACDEADFRLREIKDNEGPDVSET